jgi:hypothetical protein
MEMQRRKPDKNWSPDIIALPTLEKKSIAWGTEVEVSFKR